MIVEDLPSSVFVGQVELRQHLSEDGVFHLAQFEVLWNRTASYDRARAMLHAAMNSLWLMPASRVGNGNAQTAPFAVWCVSARVESWSLRTLLVTFVRRQMRTYLFRLDGDRCLMVNVGLAGLNLKALFVRWRLHLLCKRTHTDTLKSHKWHSRIGVHHFGNICVKSFTQRGNM